MTKTVKSHTPRPFEVRPSTRSYEPIVASTEGWLACRLCGVLLPPDEQAREPHTVRSMGRVPAPGTYIPGPMQRESEIQMTTCAACNGLRAEATRLAAEFPSGCRTTDYLLMGERAVMAVEGCLAALQLLSARHEIRGARQLRLLLREILPSVPQITWEGRFVPYADHDAKSETGAARPWAHVPAEVVAATRTAWAAWLRARVERPRPIAAPTAAACYLCGVGTVEALPSHAHHAWHTLRVRPSALGASRAAKDLTTDVRATCHAAYAELRGWGPTLLEQLVMRAAGLEGNARWQQVEVSGLRAWGTMGRTVPNPTPWAHLDLAQLDSDLRTGVF